MAGQDLSPWQAKSNLAEENAKQITILEESQVRLEEAQIRLELRLAAVHEQQQEHEIIVASLRELADIILNRIKDSQEERKQQAHSVEQAIAEVSKSVEVAIVEVSKKVRFQSAMISFGFGAVIFLLSIKMFWE